MSSYNYIFQQSDELSSENFRVYDKDYRGYFRIRVRNWLKIRINKIINEIKDYYNILKKGIRITQFNKLRSQAKKLNEQINLKKMYRYSKDYFLQCKQHDETLYYKT